MIDTSEYEGHTPIGFWQVVGQGEPEDNGEYSQQIPYWMAFSKFAKGDSRADRKLIQDAPLLLEEVERLREALYEIAKTEFFSYLKDVRPNDFLTEILEEMIE